VSIISLSVSTICSISSFVLCSVHGTFIIRLQIHISNASSLRISSFCRVHVSLPYNATLQTNAFTIRFFKWRLRDPHMRSLFLLKASFSQSNSSSYFMSTSTVFGYQTSEVTKLFNSFQILSSLIFIVLLSTVDILVILVFFVLILLLYFSDISCSASIITCNPLTVCDTMHSLICKLNR